MQNKILISLIILASAPAGANAAPSVRVLSGGTSARIATVASAARTATTLKAAAATSAANTARLSSSAFLAGKGKAGAGLKNQVVNTPSNSGASEQIDNLQTQIDQIRDNVYTKSETDDAISDAISGADGTGGSSCASNGNGRYWIEVTGGTENCVAVQMSADTFTE